MKFRSIKNSFFGGEISPNALGRTDLPIYNHACKKLTNVIPMLSGGVYKRPGTLFITKPSVSEPLPLTFRGRNNQGDQLILLSTSPASVAGTQSNAISFVLGSSYTYPDDLYLAQYVQSADILYVVHPDMKPKQLRRTVHAPTDTVLVCDFDYGLTGTDLMNAYPYRAKNTSAITLDPSASTGNITVTASADFFDADHVGALFKFYNGTETGCFKITAVASATSASATVIVNFNTNHTATTNWWESSWSDFRGWPRTISFFQDRLVYGGNYAEPDSSWYSHTANYKVMSEVLIEGSVNLITFPTSDPVGEQPFQITFLSTLINSINWISPESSTILFGTTGDEFIVEAQDPAVGFGCDNAVVTCKTHFGSSYYQVARGNGELFSINFARDTIRAYVYSNEAQNYVQENPQILYDHKPESYSGIGFDNRYFKRILWDRGRSTLWCLDLKGNFFGLTRDRKSGINTWHSHEFGGAERVIDFTVASMFGSGVEDIFLLVERVIDSQTVTHLEVIIGKERTSRAFSHRSMDIFTDASVFFDPIDETPPAALFTTDVRSGLDHLEGETVIGTADNICGIFEIQATGPVTSGDITIASPKPGGSDTYTTTEAWGLPYTATIEPVRLEAGSQIGTAQGAIKRIHSVIVRFANTMYAKVGRDSSNNEEINFRDPATPLINSADLYTGDKFIYLDSDYDRDGYVQIISDRPLPMTVISIIAEGVTND